MLENNCGIATPKRLRRPNTDGHDTTLPHQPHIICVVAIVVDVAIVEIDVPSVVGITRIGGRGL